VRGIVWAFALLAMIGGASSSWGAPEPREGETLPSDASPGRLKLLGLSLLLPGLGQRSLGATNRGYAFMGVEAAIWSAFGVFQVQGNRREDSYVEMAKLFAGVPSPSGRDSDYYRLLGSYRSSDEYDDEVRRDARARYGGDLQGRADYFEQHRIQDDQVWYWSSKSDWQRYKDKRQDSNTAYKHAETMIGLAVANRLIAAVDALRIAHKQEIGGAMSFYLTADPADPSEPARLCVSIPLR
jgi:hypothetical protein